MSAVMPAASGLYGNQWLARRYFDEISLQYRTAWDIDIKWYTVFLTFQIVGLAATVQYIAPQHRTLVVIAFVIQNILSAITAFGLSRYSVSSERRLAALSRLIVQETGVESQLERELCSSPLPTRLAEWSGAANAFSHVTLILCWVASLNIPLLPQGSTQPCAAPTTCAQAQH